LRLHASVTTSTFIMESSIEVLHPACAGALRGEEAQMLAPLRTAHSTTSSRTGLPGLYGRPNGDSRSARLWRCDIEYRQQSPNS
jgi:hypothetical protein